MSPLAEQVDRLLAPERWDEWALVYCTIRHTGTGLELWMANIPWFDFDVYGPFKHKFSFRERVHLYRKARRIRQYLLRQQESEQAERLRLALMSEEEKAIEDVLATREEGR